MSKHNLTTAIAFDLAIDPAAAGTSTLNGKVIDTNGFESIVFGVGFGAITTGAVTALKIQTGNQSDGSDMADIQAPGETAGVPVPVPDSGSNKLALSAEVHRPMKRYLRVVVTRATANSVVNGGWVALGRAGVTPPAIQPNVSNAALPPVVVSPSTP